MSSRVYGQSVGDPKVLPYDIIEVMEDAEFMKHFLRRFEMACQQTKMRGKLTGPKSWYWVYKDCPKTLYRDAIDNIKVTLGRQKSSAALLPMARTLHSIILPAVYDWVCEKEGRIPEKEIFPSTVHVFPIPFTEYYVNKKEPRPRD